MSNEVTKSVLTDGFNEDINNEDYHNDRTYISSSGLKLLLKDPREFYKVYVLGESSISLNQNAMDFGSYIHTIILEPHLVEKEYAIYQGAIRKGKEYEEFEQANKGLTILTASQAHTAQTLIDNFYKAEVDKIKISDFFTYGKAEETLCGDLEGVKVKVRFDYRTDNFISDLKTTSKSIKTKEDVEWVCASFDYDLSAALYVDMVKKYTGKSLDFYFVFLSKADGNSTIWKASSQMIKKGRQKYKKALSLLKKGRETGVYWETGIQEIDSIEI